jgi:hypothetical protein
MEDVSFEVKNFKTIIFLVESYQIWNEKITVFDSVGVLRGSSFLLHDITKFTDVLRWMLNSQLSI